MASADTQLGTIEPAVGLRPRLLVYGTPSVDELVVVLERLFPDVRVECRDSLRFEEDPNEGVVAVWHVGWTPAALSARASGLLRDLVYPLAMSRAPFVLSFESPRGVMERAALTPAELARLDLEDLRILLASDAAAEQEFSQLHLLASQTPQTPIEQRLGAALNRLGLDPRPQVRVGRYVVDFLVEQRGARVAVEADGRGFHDPVRDAERDKALQEMGITRVIRFTGSEIFRDVDACGHYVKSVLGGATGSRNGRWRPRRQVLDESQQQAVRHHGAAARVLAPAGAGKTRVLVERIAELVEAGVDSSSILALAFNKKANAQLVAQLHDLGIPSSPKLLFDDSVVGVRCATFNAFGYRFQRERLGLNFEIVEMGTVRKLMGTAAVGCGVQIAGAKRGSDPIGELVRARERALADLADPKTTEVEFDYIHRPQPVVVDYGPIDEAFERLRVRRQIQTFDDQLATAVKTLLGTPAERDFVQNYFSHILVDEFQDLNATQLALVDVLSRPWRRLFVVGDDDQLIYGWRFARLTNMLDFEKRMPAAQTYALDTNYRCSAAIVDSSSRLIGHNQNRVAKNIKPRDGAPEGTVSYAASAAMDERLAALVAFIRLQRPRVERWRDIAVLCRYKAQQPFVAMALDQAGIPRTPLLRYRLFNDRNMDLLRTYLKLADAPGLLAGDELALVLNRPNRFATNELLSSLGRSRRPWADFTTYLDQQPDEDGFRYSALSGFRQRVEQLHNRLRQDGVSPAELVDEVVRVFDLERFWRDERSPDGREQDEADPLELVDLIRLHAAEADDLSTFLEAWDERQAEESRGTGMDGDELAREEPEGKDRVVIGTMHASKGREYEAVALYDYHVNLSRLDNSQVEEERRVFYVGMTRARAALLITIDSDKSLHAFIRESIAPEKPQESDALAESKMECRDEARRAKIDLARAEDKLAQVQDGRERTRLETERGVAVEHLRSREATLAELDQWLARSRVWHKLSGKRRQVDKEADIARDQLAQARARVGNLDDDLTLLSIDTPLYAEPFADEVKIAKERVASLERRLAVVAAREHQLTLLRS